jgi:PAS domain S-box-containing protein
VEWSDDAIFSKTLKGIITTWNRAAERLYGYAAAEIVGRPVSLLVPPDRLDEVPAILARLARGETVDRYRSVRRRKDGRQVDVSLTVSPILDPSGRVIGASTIARDLSEQVEAVRDQGFLLELAAALQATSDPAIMTADATRRLGEYLGAMACVFSDLDLAHDVAFVRAAYRRGEPVSTAGSFALSLLGEGTIGTLAAGEAMVVADTATDERTGGARVRRQHEASSTRSFVTVPLSRAGRLAAMLSLRDDVPREWTPREVGPRLWPALDAARALAAEREARLAAESASIEAEMALEEAHAAFAEAEQARAQAQALAVTIEEANQELVRLAATAEAANRAKSEFLAVMSHELRTPLTAIAGYSQLLEMGLFGALSEKQLHQIGRIRAAEEHLLRVIEGVLAFTRVEVGKVVYELDDVAVADVLGGVDILIGPQADAAGVELLLGSVPRDLVARADGEKLRQIVLNLLSNGVKFTPRGGRVRLECVGEDEVVIRVHDTGIGIPADRLEEIFEPFTQVERANTRQHGGTGLGLAIAREFARGMRGEISVVSVLGVGSIFSVRLPRGEGAGAERAG